MAEPSSASVNHEQQLCASTAHDVLCCASSTRSPGTKQLLRTTSFHSVQPTLPIIACRAALGHHSIGSKLTKPLPTLILKRRTWAMYLVVELHAQVLSPSSGGGM